MLPSRISKAVAAALTTFAATTVTACFLVSSLSYLEGPPLDGGREGGSFVDARPDVVQDATEATDATDATAVPCATILLHGNARVSLAKFVGRQVVDGYDSEFCGLEGTTIVAANAANPQPSAEAGIGVASTASLRVGWSSLGLHVFIDVARESVLPAPLDGDLYNGDAVEIYAKPPGPITGDFGPPFDRAVQVIVAPPTSTQRAQSEILNAVGDGPLGALDGGQYAARLVDGGYQVEMYLSWNFLNGGSDAGLIDGGVIGFDFAGDIPRSGGQRFQYFLGYRDAGVNDADLACPEHPQPHCDDRTWCRPVLNSLP